MKIIECVPNFSEGKNPETLEALRQSISGIPGVKLLSLEPDGDYNRVVVTFAGDEKGVLQAAVAMSKTAGSLIDMTVQKGEHPRLGAIDVVPFVPVRNASMEECVELAKEYGKQVSEALNIPIFLYEEAAQKPERRNLSDIRKGEYEGLAEKLQDPTWAPDFGKAEFNAKLGGTVTGARFFLVAYNVNLKTTDLNISKEISEIIRESGRPKRDENGQIVKIDGKTVREPGRLKCVKAMGVALEKYGITQVSINMTNFTVTPLHVAFEEVKKEATRLGAEVTGSEIVGLVPLQALLDTGKYYAAGKELNEKELVELAIEKLGLADLNTFDVQSKIIDYMI
ncbi:MAG: glutamate formimidoyltransferase [Ignavibacteria bacterium]|nr:glutamate formimidoyltransferase [Ignavibacteria bacterium]